MAVAELKTRIDPNIQIISHLNCFFRQKRESLQEEQLRKRFSLDRDKSPDLDDYRLFSDDFTLDFNRDWSSSVALLRSDGNVDPEISDLDVALLAKLDAPVAVKDAPSLASLFFRVLFCEEDKNPFYTIPRRLASGLPDPSVSPFAELRIGLTADAPGNPSVENGYFKHFAFPMEDDEKVKFYAEGDSNGEASGSFLFGAETCGFKRPVENVRFNLDLSQVGNPPSDFSGLSIMQPVVGLGVEEFRIYGSKRIPALDFGGSSASADSSINAIEIGRHLEESGKLAINFYELRGEKDPYTGCAHTVFIFRCWGSPESDSRALWMLLDEALHNKFNEYWGDLFVYSSLRRDMPELSLGDELRHLDAFNFMCAYDVVYWEYDEGE